MGIPLPMTCPEQSYEISPYKQSDDENEEDDDAMLNSKFVPSWSSKNCLALAVSCQNGADPGAIFPRESFCSISEVLLLGASAKLQWNALNSIQCILRSTSRTAFGEEEVTVALVCMLPFSNDYLSRRSLPANL
ncbi:uncharacterized protein Pyn_24967 [Prunus yedoensis var. nudiflora]|uniref:Inner centromere protein ARK-binding domain-containing protein n=1 Tax=Prunus yedoensis var. nudiflora TaxID=2094558 RepID=A0A314UE90_PRUYE|nr:uncharacterized protein Pyn_24967 [Prunus yedoensis var. nudiflora]